MKNLLTSLMILIPAIGMAQNSDYALNSYQEEGFKAPNTHYIGEAWLNRLIGASDSLGYNMTKATFRANSTLDWHKHTTPQVLIFVEGEGYYQERGKDPVRVKEGDVLTCPPDVEHWHASSKEHDVTYLAIYSGETVWTEVLTQEAYDEVGRQLKPDHEEE